MMQQKQGNRSVSAPLDAPEFRTEIHKQYPNAKDTRAAVVHAVEDTWAAPEFRENQKDAVIDILTNLYVADKDVVMLSAPTGAGKSLILHGVMRVLIEIHGKDAFFSTPLNSLIDQVKNDEFMGDDIVTLKGKNNYNCVHHQDKGTPVDKAICQRVDDLECEYKDMAPEDGGCPYYGRKNIAQEHPEFVTNMSYMMANAMIPEEYGFPPREVGVVDECQSIEDFALQFVSVTVSKRSVPVVWDQIPQPPRGENMDDLVEWLRMDVIIPVREKLKEYDANGNLSEQQAEKRDKLNQFSRKVNNLLNDVEDHHWVVESDSDNDGWTVSFEPIFVGRFLDRFLWGQSNKVVLSSATIPRGNFTEEVGIDSKSVATVEVESTFPPERRPVITDYAVGKMTWGERDATTPKMANKIGELARHHDGERGFIHCHSYGIAERLYETLPTDIQHRTRVQDQDDREGSLDGWLAADVDETSEHTAYDVDDTQIGGQIFLSVAMDEGVSLDGDKTRWQVIAKGAYPFMNDKRVSYRLNELNDWNWYAGKAAINLQQAVGRGMRSKDDWCHTYVLDTSAVQLIDRNEHLFESWFKSAVDIESRSSDSLRTDTLCESEK